MPEELIMERIQHPTKLAMKWSFAFAKNHPITTMMINEICNFYPYFRGKTFENPNLQLNQAGIDYNGHAIPEMPGSWSRYFTSPAYGKSKNRSIVL